MARQTAAKFRQTLLPLRFELMADSDMPLVSWQGDRLIREMALAGLSSILKRDEGGGTSCAIHLAQYGRGGNSGDVVVLPGISSELELEIELLERAPSDWAGFRTDRGYQKLFKPKTNATRCGTCKKSCPLDDRGGSYQAAFRATTLQAKGHCPLRLEVGMYFFLEDDSPVIIDLPPDAKLKVGVDLASQLLKEGRVIVMLALGRQIPQLRRDPNIAALPVGRFPRMTPAELARIFKLAPDNPLLDAANGNPRQMATLLNMDRANRALALKRLAALPLGPPRLLGVGLTPAEAVQTFVESHQGEEVLAGQVARWAQEKFGLWLSPREVAARLREQGCRLRHGKAGSLFTLPGQAGDSVTENQIQRPKKKGENRAKSAIKGW